MTDRQEDRERELSELFDREGDSGKDRALRDYQLIRETMREFPVKHTAPGALSSRMLREYQKRPLFRLPLAACFAMLLFTSLYAGWLLHTPEAPAVSSIAFTHSNSGVPRAASFPPLKVPWLWEKRINQGRLVTVPDGAKAQLRLRDGSVAECEPGTQIAIDYTHKRNIHIQYGYISIQANPIPDSTMTVFTPLNRVEVVGTKFWVKVSSP